MSSIYCPRCDDDTIENGECLCGYVSPNYIKTPIELFRETDDTTLILAMLKYATTRGDAHYDTTLDQLGQLAVNAIWNGRSFVLSAEQREQIWDEMPAAYWMGAINDSLE